ncbi:MAG: phosphatidylglycerol lysyltransferase domain-containing protein [Nitrospirota bacterium]
MYFDNINAIALKPLVESDLCFKCDVCCRFIDKESPLRPYFSRDEIWRLINAGVSPMPFKRLDGCKIDLIPYGDLHICPFFGSGENRCTIYEMRPLDCRIYPVAVMRACNEACLFIGLDTKCPFSDEIKTADVGYYADLLSSNSNQEGFSGIIGDFQDDVRVMFSLDIAISPEERRVMIPPDLKPLGISDKPVFDKFLFGTSRLSSHSFIANYIWGDLLSYHWKIIDGCLCLFAEYDQNIYMPIPPVGNNPRMASAKAFEIMAKVNKNPSVSRIEDLDDKELKEILSSSIAIVEDGSPGYRNVLKGYEYIYKRDDLVSLKGNPYKGKRSSVNRFLSHINYSYEPFRPSDLGDCLSLYIRWMKERYDSNQDETYRQMLYDSYSAHRRAMKDYNDLDLMGRVVRINGSIAGYTFGFRLGPDFFAVLSEIVDRTARGLPQFIFRESCKGLEGISFINAMDDSGLESIRRTKLSYHPSMLEPSYIVSLDIG